MCMGVRACRKEVLTYVIYGCTSLQTLHLNAKFTKATWESCLNSALWPSPLCLHATKQNDKAVPPTDLVRRELWQDTGPLEFNAATSLNYHPNFKVHLFLHFLLYAEKKQIQRKTNKVKQQNANHTLHHDFMLFHFAENLSLLRC